MSAQAMRKVWDNEADVDNGEASKPLHVPAGAGVAAQVTTNATAGFDLQGSMDGSVWSVIQTDIVVNAGPGTGVGVYKAAGGTAAVSAVPACACSFPMVRLACKNNDITVTAWLSAQ